MVVEIKVTLIKQYYIYQENYKKNIEICSIGFHNARAFSFPLGTLSS